MLDPDILHHKMLQAELEIQRIDADAKKVKYCYASKDLSGAIVDKSQSFSKIIGEIIRKDLANIINDILISIDWNVPEFIQQERLDEQSLSSFIILTTNEIHAQATTCKEYLSWRWPRLSSSLMLTLEKIANGSEGIIDGESGKKGLFWTIRI